MLSSGGFLCVSDTDQRRKSSPETSQELFTCDAVCSRRRSSMFAADQRKWHELDSLELESSRRKLTVILTISGLLILIVLLFSFVRLIL